MQVCFYIHYLAKTLLDFSSIRMYEYFFLNYIIMSEKYFFKENNGHARMPACPSLNGAGLVSEPASLSLTAPPRPVFLRAFVGRA